MQKPDRHVFPRLRYVETHPVVHQNRAFVMLRDPLQLSDQMVLIPKDLTPALGLLDGTVELSAMQEILSSEYGFQVTQAEIDEIVLSLDKAFLLENERSAAAMEKELQDFRGASFRPAMLAGNSYPAQDSALRKTLEGYIKRIGAVETAGSHIRGLISPHIDYERGWRVYADVWERSRDAIRAAELVIILGTDHYGADRTLTLTRQHFATPYGILPTPGELVDTLAEAIGSDQAFDGELYHRNEHSIELAAVWLHHIRQGETCELLPILCGSFTPFMQDEDRVADNELFSNAIEALRSMISGKRCLIVAAADLSHVGPVFGGVALDLQGHARLQTQDQGLLDDICNGDADAFLARIFTNEDRNNVCGTAPIYIAMKILTPLQGTCTGYEHCPADTNHSSTVSICGVLFE